MANQSIYEGFSRMWTHVTSALNGKSDKGHEHNALDISAGTLPIERGGTGATSAAGAVSNLGITASIAELNYVDGVTSKIQTQLNGKQETVTGAATTVVKNDLTANRVVISNSNKKLAVSGITTTELNYLGGASSNIQDQINLLHDASEIDWINLNEEPTTVQNALTSHANTLNQHTDAIQTINALAGGSATQPIYFKDGKPVATTYALNKTVPSNALFTDTLNTAGSSNTSSKIFLVGTTSQTENAQSYSHDTVYVGTDGHLYSNGKQAVNLSDTQALTNKTYNGYTLAAACAKGVTDSTSASAISTGTNLVTERDVYYGLASINGSRQTSSVSVYAPTSVGTDGYVLQSEGSGAPIWVASTTLTAGKLNTNAGDTSTPVFFSNGIPKECTSLDLDTTGNAATATVLKTGRTLQVDLASTTAPSFNGSANVSIGVTGTLPLSQGGTGANLARTSNAIIRYSSSGNYMSSTPTANGAFYATGANGSPSFGTLPIAQGGTGATNAADVISNLGITASATELNYVGGVTSKIQTQLNNKAAKEHTHTVEEITDIDEFLKSYPDCDLLVEFAYDIGYSENTKDNCSIKYGSIADVAEKCRLKKPVKIYIFTQHQYDGTHWSIYQANSVHFEVEEDGSYNPFVTAYIRSGYGASSAIELNHTTNTIFEVYNFNYSYPYIDWDNNDSTYGREGQIAMKTSSGHDTEFKWADLPAPVSIVRW